MGKTPNKEQQVPGHMGEPWKNRDPPKAQARCQ